MTNRIGMDTYLRDWSDEALCSLTHEEVERYVDLQCARLGKPLLPADPGPEPVAPAVKVDTTVYGVSLGYNDVATLDSQEAALELSRALSAAKSHTVAVSYVKGYDGPKYVKGLDERSPKVEPIEVVSRSEVERTKDAREEWERAYRSWKALSTEYKEASKARGDVWDEVNELIDEAQSRQRRRRQAEERLGRYVDLAGGDRATGLRFFEAHARESGNAGDIDLLGIGDELRALTTAAPSAEEDEGEEEQPF